MRLTDFEHNERTAKIAALGSIQLSENRGGVQPMNAKLTTIVGDYRNVPILPDSVIYCFDKNTEILTQRGWVNICEVELTDKCLSREPDAGNLEWVDVVNVIKYRHKGKMYLYQGKNVDVCVTPNHRMFTTWTHGRSKDESDVFITAEDLYRSPSTHRFVSACGKWQGDTEDTVEICGQSFDKRDFAYLLGVFLTDGSVNNQGSISISQTKIKVRAKLEGVLSRLGIDYSVYRIKRGGIETGGITYYIPRKFLPYFKQFYKKECREIPQEAREWSKEYLESLMEGIIDGDGSEGRRIFCGSKPLVDSIQEVCYKMGLSANISTVQPKKQYLIAEDRYIEGKKPYYILSINHRPYLNVIRSNQSWVDYDDMVGCVTLSKWHTVLVRRNGKSIWCGQCDPPYKDTGGYGMEFDHEAFYDWCEKQTSLVLISEYWMPEDRFVCIAEFERKSTFSATNNSLSRIEKVFVPKGQFEMYKQMMDK